MIFLKILTRGIDHTFSHSEQKKFGEQNYKGCKKNYSAHILNYSAHIFSHVPNNFTLFYPKKSDKNEGDTPAVGVSPFLYTNIQHISAKSKCPPSELEISLFLIFYTWQPLAQNSEKFAHIKHRMTQNFVFDRRT